jgi:hypothetical protein
MRKIQEMKNKEKKRKINIVLGLGEGIRYYFKDSDQFDHSSNLKSL